MPNDIEKNNGLSPNPDSQDKEASSDSAASNIKEEETLEPRITAEEFEKLEKKEQNQKLFGFLQKSKKEDTPQSSTDMTPTNTQYLEKKINDTLLKVEKMEGKFEMIGSSKSEANERLANLAEEIGELRSMIFSREDAFSGIETEFEKIKESSAHMKPEKIHREIEDNALEVMKMQAQLDLQKSKISELEKTQTKITKLLDRFKSFENLLDISKEIKSEIEKIKDSEKYTTRMAAKTEKIFSELDNRLSEFQKYKKEVNDMNEMIKDLIRSNDALEVKTDSLMSKDSFSKIKEEQENKSGELDTRIKILKDIVSTLVDKMSREGISGASLADIETIETIKSSIKRDVLHDLEKSTSFATSKRPESTPLECEDRAAQQTELHEAKKSGNDNCQIPSIWNQQEEMLPHITRTTPSQNHTDTYNQSGISKDHDDFSDQSVEKQVFQIPSILGKYSPLEIPEPSPEPSPESKEMSLAKKHMEKVKGIFKKINPIKPVSELYSVPVDGLPHNPLTSDLSTLPHQEKESDSFHERQNDISGETKTLNTDLKKELLRLKSLYHEKEALLESEKRSGKDIFNQETLLENASLDLSMAELDILDGNETISRQKIERINTLLENVR